ncbi:MAG: hypothetical protein FJ387_16770 [Verrucomicrobia bacterium]|nr:hypothetical protein [Verrucomicrobiota bacterium]
MSARNDLLRLYQEWRVWSDAEADAIKTSAWPQVSRCQDAKQALQERIVSATERWVSEERVPGEPARDIDPQVRRLVDELILLEMRNGELLADQRLAARSQQQQVERSRRNLRQIQRVYAPSRQALWESYS